MDHRKVKIDHDAEKIIIDALKLYRQPNVDASQSPMRSTLHDISEEHISSKKSIYRQRSESKESMDTPKYMSSMREPMATHQTIQSSYHHSQHPGSRERNDLDHHHLKKMDPHSSPSRYRDMMNSVGCHK